MQCSVYGSLFIPICETEGPIWSSEQSEFIFVSLTMRLVCRGLYLSIDACSLDTHTHTNSCCPHNYFLKLTC